MIDIKLIRENIEVVKKNLEKRKDKEKLGWLKEIEKLDKEWRQKKYDMQKIVHKKNELSKEVATLKKEGKDAAKVLEALKEIPKEAEKAQEEVDKLKDKIDHYLMRMPNILHESVPYGKDDTENEEVRVWGKPKDFGFDLKNHGELAEELGIGEFKKAAEVSGSGFYYLKGELAHLNQALLQFATDQLVKKGFCLVIPPLMMRKGPYSGVTDIQEFEDVIYKVEDEDLYLIATAEHPMAAMYMGETIPEEKLPLKLVGVSPCFRKEIGSHGVDTKGLFRVHQFWKVEQFVFCHPEKSWEMHEELLKNSEELFEALELPYRVVNICTGDIGIVAAKKYDLEVWMPRQKDYKEACSCSNCTDYQARRLGIKFGKEGGDKELLHTLNNTAIATSRAMVAILENYQNEDGTVTVPKVLVPYMNGKKVIGKK